MRLVIDIPKELYEECKKLGDKNDTLFEAISKGKILPKEHGKLVVLSIDKLKENLIDLSFSCQKWISEVGLSLARVSTIEADKEAEE